MRTPVKAAVGLLCALGLFTTGCAGDDGGGSAGKGKRETSPLEKYLGQGRELSSYGGGGGQAGMTSFSFVGAADGGSAKDQAKHRKVENSIAACMRKAGFEYVPVPPRKPKKSAFEKADDLPPAEYAKRWGYGVATVMSAGDQGEEDFKDPNDPIRGKLSKKAQKAYEKALHGDMALAEEAGASGGGKVEVRKGSPAGPAGPGGGGDEGCMGEASRKVFGDPAKAMKQETKFKGLLADVDALRKRMAKDPRMTKAYAAWSDCMADAGHPKLRTPADARESIESGLGKAMESKDQEGRMKKLAKQEIELATADFRCKDEHVNAVERKVRWATEAAFVKDNRAGLERYKDFRAEREKSGGPMVEFGDGSMTVPN